MDRHFWKVTYRTHNGGLPTILFESRLPDGAIVRQVSLLRPEDSVKDLAKDHLQIVEKEHAWSMKRQLEVFDEPDTAEVDE